LAILPIGQLRPPPPRSQVRRVGYSERASRTQDLEEWGAIFLLNDVSPSQGTDDRSKRRELHLCRVDIVPSHHEVRRRAAILFAHDQAAQRELIDVLENGEFAKRPRILPPVVAVSKALPILRTHNFKK